MAIIIQELLVLIIDSMMNFSMTHYLMVKLRIRMKLAIYINNLVIHQGTL